jgi:pimeloyl-ACP methyl ester carboxylesterase
VSALARAKKSAFILFGGLLLCGAVLVNQLPNAAAGALLHPERRTVNVARPEQCEDAVFLSDDVRLQGWSCRAIGAQRGTIVYLHGVGDNRASAVGVIDRFVHRGFNVVVYDSRAHGESTGDICTYGYFGNVIYEESSTRLRRNALC